MRRSFQSPGIQSTWFHLPRVLDIDMLIVLLALFAAEPLPFTSPASPQPEYGHELTADEALAGWIALFDGETTFGWSDAAVENGSLTRGHTASPFGSCEIKGKAETAGQMTIG